jgi:hypothetical protein
VDNGQKYLLKKLKETFIKRDFNLRDLSGKTITEEMIWILNEYKEIEHMITNDEIDTTDQLSMGIIYGNISNLKRDYVEIIKEINESEK